MQNPRAFSRIKILIRDAKIPEFRKYLLSRKQLMSLLDQHSAIDFLALSNMPIDAMVSAALNQL